MINKIKSRCLPSKYGHTHRHTTDTHTHSARAFEQGFSPPGYIHSLNYYNTLTKLRSLFHKESVRKKKYKHVIYGQNNNNEVFDNCTADSGAQWWRVASPSHDHSSVFSEPSRAPTLTPGVTVFGISQVFICWKEDNVRLGVSLNQTAVLMCPRAKMVRTISTSAAGSRTKEVRYWALLIPLVTCGLLLSRRGNANYSL